MERFCIELRIEWKEKENWWTKRQEWLTWLDLKGEKEWSVKDVDDNSLGWIVSYLKKNIDKRIKIIKLMW